MGITNVTTKLKKPLSKDNIFTKVTALQVFEYYLGRSLSLPITIKSPLRKEDVSSFCIFGRNAYDVYFEDKATKDKGSAIDFVMRLFNISFYEALVKINLDFNLGLAYNEVKYQLSKAMNTTIPEKKEIINERKIISIQSHKNSKGEPMFVTSGINYWKQFHIATPMLHRHNVFSANDVFINGKHIAKYVDVNPIFAYLYFYKSEPYYKIYRPLTVDRTQKFYNDFHGVSKYLIHGVKLLPERGETLIITKSAKDVMVLDTCGFNSVAVQSESMSILPHHMEWFRQRWNNIILLFDNDVKKEQNWGQLNATAIIKEFPFIRNSCIPDEYGEKDISDVIRRYGINTTKELINKLIL